MKNRTVTIRTGLVIAVSLGSATAQTVRYVDPNATGNNMGASWTNAYTNLQTALSAAQVGWQIWVKQGTYLGGYTVGEGTLVYGGFAGGWHGPRLRGHVYL